MTSYSPGDKRNWIRIALAFFHLGVMFVSPKIHGHSEKGQTGNYVHISQEPHEGASLEKANWLPWSSWSECTRTCDGGATFQYRQCPDQQECFGSKIRYKLCNTKPCPSETTDFRAQQCAAYNNFRMKSQLHRWRPYINPKKPCALTCRSEEENFIKELAPQVLDGTRCREGSLDMCINGACMPVGCDLTLGSTLKLDTCGVCGGDGSVCGKQSFFNWKEESFSECSRLCGGGHQSTSSFCVNTESGAVVGDSLCDTSQRPATQMRECNKHSCNTESGRYESSKAQTHLHQWATDPWGPCTTECNGGSQARRVYCLQYLTNGTKHPVGDFRCIKHTQPSTERSCNNHVCPEWQTSSWSNCSATCGRGSQVRSVKCVDYKGFDSNVCDKSRKPTDKKSCKVSSFCPTKWSPRPEDRPHSEQALPLVAPYPYPWGDQMDADELSKYEDSPMFAIGPWSECSASCGHGFRQRNVECKLYIKFSVKLVQLPDSECSDSKPVEREPCTRRPCEEGSSANITGGTPFRYGYHNRSDDKSANRKPGTGIDVTYSWHYDGLTGCTKTCLGGVRHAIIRCFRDHDQSSVEEKFCKAVQRPPELRETCHDVPCPPRWNTSDFSPCSKTCGGGIQMRTVQCVQELGSTPNDLLNMPVDSCPYPPPRTQMACNPADCPPAWDVSEWSPCSKSCGKGVVERTVVCRQRMASGDVQDIVDFEACPKVRPPIMKSCFTKACPPGMKTTSTPISSASALKPVTLNFSKGKNKANKLKVGSGSGTAVLYEGTDLRLKCPVFGGVGGQRATVAWFKDGKPIPYSKSLKAHVKMSALGAIKIKALRMSDGGTYTCVTGRVRESIQLTILSKTATGNTQTSNNPLFIGHLSGNTIQRFYANSTDALRILQTVSQKTTPFSNALSDNEPRVTHDRMALYSEQSTVTERQELVEPTEEPSTRAPEVVKHDLSRIITRMLEDFKQPTSRQYVFLDQNPELSSDGQRLVIPAKTGDSIMVFEWIAGEWSVCSQNCGGGGAQVRTVDCQVGLDNEKQIVQHFFCINVNLAKAPETTRPCGWNECPEWRTEAWTDCEKSECFALDTAIQSRNVSCGFPNGTMVPTDFCAADGRPQERRDCANHKCKAVWKTESWSECTVTCGPGGIRSRILKCVWSGTSRPAGNMCRSLERPAVKDTCDAQPDCTNEPQCRDHFKYCDYANSLKLCRQKAYRLRCCRTCDAHHQNTT